MDALLRRLADPFLMVLGSVERLYWLYLGCALLLAFGVFVRERGGLGSARQFLQFVFPKEVYLDRSARLDYCYFVVNRIAAGIVLLPASLATTLAAAAGTRAGLAAVLGSAPVAFAETPTSAALQTVLTALAIDFGLFWAHLLQHRVPVLWEFHKVHHSAGVLTPITAYRMHPVDDLLSLLLVGTLGGAVSGCFEYLQPGNSGPFIALGLNVLVFAFYAVGFNLRHSHVWLSYGPLFSHVFVSPAQHQLHHSLAERHLDKNYGFIFAFWDAAFGSLYVPRAKEDITFGLANGEGAEYSSLRRLYLLPFAKNAHTGVRAASAALLALLLIAGSVVGLMATSRLALAAPDSVFIEELTWQEVQAAVASGKTTAIYYAGSTEQNGPHMVLGKHNFIARYVAQRIAENLGNALVYPIMPFAPTGDPLAKSGHMRFPGTVSVSEQTFAAVANDAALSAAAAGFRHIVLMGDHGGGQGALKQVSEKLDAQWARKGVRVRYVPDLYYKSQQQVREYLAARGMAAGRHAGAPDTSELMFLDREGKWLRKEKLARGDAGNGVDGDPRLASAEAGEAFLNFKIANAVAQIRSLTGAAH
jgi:sterol desaturase/sphingolipid hydroxylase (fatty acid hydroxylase superfamily)/creatinine amidohydrolase/Fe(II)-dependent formamide hydrolase-like protein